MVGGRLLRRTDRDIGPSSGMVSNRNIGVCRVKCRRDMLSIRTAYMVQSNGHRYSFTSLWVAIAVAARGIIDCITLVFENGSRTAQRYIESIDT